MRVEIVMREGKFCLWICDLHILKWIICFYFIVIRKIRKAKILISKYPNWDRFFHWNRK